MSESMRLVLASASRARTDMLRSAGLAFTAIPADIDETVIRETLTEDNDSIDPADVAEVLARAKAGAVSRAEPDAVVVGADQILAIDDEMFEKPATMVEARLRLKRLSGKTHALHTAAAIAENGEVTWITVETAYLTMREISTPFIDDYLLRAGERVCHTVGAYELEGLGAQLFEKIEGDYFTILGLPLLPLLRELRARKVIAV